jgi:excisionase family DNA binding protein
MQRLNKSSSNKTRRSVSKLRTIDETAELLRVSKRTVQRLIKSGALPVHHIMGAVRISDADIAELLDATCASKLKRLAEITLFGIRHQIRELGWFSTSAVTLKEL